MVMVGNLRPCRGGYAA